MFSTPLKIPHLINILRVEKIPCGTTFASQWLIGHVFGPLFGYRWRVHAAWVKVNRLVIYYGTTSDFPKFGGHFRHFFGVRYGKCEKSAKDGLGWRQRNASLAKLGAAAVSPAAGDVVAVGAAAGRRAM